MLFTFWVLFILSIHFFWSVSWQIFWVDFQSIFRWFDGRFLTKVQSIFGWFKTIFWSVSWQIFGWFSINFRLFNGRFSTSFQTIFRWFDGRFLTYLQLKLSQFLDNFKPFLVRFEPSISGRFDGRDSINFHSILGAFYGRFLVNFQPIFVDLMADFWVEFRPVLINLMAEIWLIFSQFLVNFMADFELIFSFWQIFDSIFGWFLVQCWWFHGRFSVNIQSIFTKIFCGGWFLFDFQQLLSMNRMFGWIHGIEFRSRLDVDHVDLWQIPVKYPANFWSENTQQMAPRFIRGLTWLWAKHHRWMMSTSTSTSKLQTPINYRKRKSSNWPNQQPAAALFEKFEDHFLQVDHKLTISISR